MRVVVEIKDLLRSVSVIASSAGGVTAVNVSWIQYHPITTHTTMYTHGMGREESAHVRVTGRAHAGCEVGRTDARRGRARGSKHGPQRTHRHAQARTSRTSRTKPTKARVQ
eukprot:3315444-Prymnesium_polylepis.1